MYWSVEKKYLLENGKSKRSIYTVYQMTIKKNILKVLKPTHIRPDNSLPDDRWGNHHTRRWSVRRTQPLQFRTEIQACVQAS